MKFSISIDTDPGITDTIGTINAHCPVLRTVAVYLTSLSLCLDGANTCGLKVINGVMAARSPRSSGSHGAVELGWWYSAGLQVLLQSVPVALVPTYWQSLPLHQLSAEDLLWDALVNAHQ